jgi:hypothetical protein
MAGYLGHNPVRRNYVVDEFTTSAAQASSGNFTLSQTISDSKFLEVSVGGIDQPQSAYSVTGTTLAFGANIVAQNDIVIVRHAGESIMYPTLEANAVDSGNITAGAVDLAHMSANSVDSSELKTGSVDLAHLSATGTPSASLALKGDYSWGTAGGTSLAGGMIRTNLLAISSPVTFAGTENGVTYGPVSVTALVTVTSPSVWHIL